MLPPFFDRMDIAANMVFEAVTYDLERVLMMHLFLNGTKLNKKMNYKL